MDGVESLARWFLARSDVEAALRLWDAHVRLYSLYEYIGKRWPQVLDVAAYDKVYREAGPIEAATPDCFDRVKHAWRLQMARNFIQQQRELRAKALDYGCSRAYYSTHLHNDTWVKGWTCVDIDPTSVEDARRQVERNAREPEKFDFACGTEDAIPGEGYGLALLFEVLEHVRDPRRTLQAIESKLAPEGQVIISLPSGPVEYSMWVEHPERNREHIREYTLDDIFEVFGGKPELRVNYTSYGPSKYLPSMVEGCFFITYRRSDQPIGEVDWGRKLSGARSAVALPGL